MQQTQKPMLEILTLAMEKEKGAHDFYAQAASKASQAKGKQTFQWLAGEETKHYQKLSAAREALAGNKKLLVMTEVPISTSELPTFERGLDPGRSGMAEAAGGVAPDAGELEALSIGIESEKKALQFYNQSAGTAGSREMKDLLLKLAAEEQGHLDLLEREHEWVKNSGQYFTIHRFTIRSD